MSMQNNSKAISPFLPWAVWGLAALFYAYEFFLQVSPSVMVPDLMHTFNQTAASLGNLAALYFYAYAVMQIPAGMFLDTLGPRRLLTVASGICVIGALLFGMAHSLWVAQVGRLLIGFGSSFAAIGTFKLGSTWFPLNRFAYITGLTLTIGMLGAVIGGAPLAILVDIFGWRTSMIILGIVGMGISILIWTIVRDSPNYFLPPSTNIHAIPQMSIMKGLLHIFKKPQNWLVSIYGGLMFAPTSAFAALWGTSFLMTRYGIERPFAAGAISMIFFGWAVGGPLFGWISDHMGKRKPTMYMAAIGALITMLLIIYSYLSPTNLHLVLFGFGFFSSGFLPSFSIIREINPSNNSATALGFMNMLNMVGGAILQPLIGWILDRNWQGYMHLNVRAYSVHAYHIGLVSLPAIIALALILLPFIKETACHQEEEQSTASLNNQRDTLHSSDEEMSLEYS